MHRRGRQQRRDGHAVGVDQAVGHDQDVVAALHRVDGARAQRRHARLDAFRAPGGRIGDVQLITAEFLAGDLVDVADLRHGGEIQHGLRHFQAQRRVDVVDVEQVGLGADERDQRHDHLLADRVDRRVGHLREQLAEVVVERLGAVRQHGQRGIVAHRADHFLAAGGHGFEDELEILLGPAERLLAVEQRHGRLGGRRGGPGRGQRFQLDLQAFDPLAVRAAVGQLQLDLAVVDDAALLQVDQEHLARLQAPFLDDAVFRDRQRARLGRHDDHVVVGDQVARRTQAVAVQRGADLAAVGEGDRGRPVPGLHHGGVVLVEGAPAFVHLRVLFPGFRDHHHHGVRQGIAGVHQQFEAVVERGGIGLAFVDDGVQLLQVVAQHRGLHHALAGPQPVEVALDRVDFAVVGDHAVRVGQRPGGERVGREALVHQRQRRYRARIGQVAIVAADLVGQQQALVDHGAHRGRGHEVFLAVRQAHVLDGVAGGLADHVQLAFQRVGHHHVGAAADEQLADDRFEAAHRGRHRHFDVHRHVAPAQHDLAFGADRALQLLFTGQARGGFLGQEHHCHAVFARRRQDDALLSQFVVVQRVGNLDQDAGAVAHQLVGAHGAAVIQVFQDLQALLDDGVALAALDMGHEADATGVVLVVRVIQALGGGQADTACVDGGRRDRATGIGRLGIGHNALRSCLRRECCSAKGQYCAGCAHASQKYGV
ncbi:Uncharacterised protein [Bordetella pertussis]|nr:Uncharacterised protein [Bordetella pertussis]